MATKHKTPRFPKTERRVRVNVRHSSDELVISRESVGLIAAALSALDCTIVEASEREVYFEAGFMGVGWSPMGAVTSGQIRVEVVGQSVELVFVMRFGQVVPIFAFVVPMGGFLAFILSGADALVPMLTCLLGLLVVCLLSAALSTWTLPSHILWKLATDGHEYFERVRR